MRLGVVLRWCLIVSRIWGSWCRWCLYPLFIKDWPLIDTVTYIACLIIELTFFRYCLIACSSNPKPWTSFPKLPNLKSESNYHHRPNKKDGPWFLSLTYPSFDFLTFSTMQNTTMKPSWAVKKKLRSSTNTLRKKVNTNSGELFKVESQPWKIELWWDHFLYPQPSERPFFFLWSIKYHKKFLKISWFDFWFFFSDRNMSFPPDRRYE